jgi:nitroreductase
MNKLLRNAHRSPSAGHIQVQEFIVVIDPITKRKLCQASLGQSQVNNASVLIIVCSNTSRPIGRYRKRVLNSIVLSMVHLLP